MKYAADQWHSRIVTGTSALKVERWLADVETRTRLPGRASGKPLMWIHLADCSEAVPKKISASRSVGVLTDVLRALDRSLSVDDLDRLHGIFDKDGRTFIGTVDFA